LSGGESDQVSDDLFIVVEGSSQAVQGEWPTVVVQIQCFSFDLRGEARDEALLEDEAEAASSFCLHGKEV
jgi:hypothetical protein